MGPMFILKHSMRSYNYLHLLLYVILIIFLFLLHIIFIPLNLIYLILLCLKQRHLLIHLMFLQLIQVIVLFQFMFLTPFQAIVQQRLYHHQYSQFLKFVLKLFKNLVSSICDDEYYVQQNLYKLLQAREAIVSSKRIYLNINKIIIREY